jgi:hypothetical protein
MDELEYCFLDILALWKHMQTNQLARYALFDILMRSCQESYPKHAFDGFNPSHSAHPRTNRSISRTGFVDGSRLRREQEFEDLLRRRYPIRYSPTLVLLHSKC